METKKSSSGGNLRVAIVGAGRIGIVHAGSVYNTPGAETVLVVDPMEASVSKCFGQRIHATLIGYFGFPRQIFIWFTSNNAEYFVSRNFKTFAILPPNETIRTCYSHS
jgi:hypothetical protein